ncbi:hypothetical protein FYK55_07365 [Roseiconus nitratireducens]|uniref:Uncharacterized protein n=1 Tax=Roseiconus nitratireducens TaxID=2605748 RepID=A0A5M6DD68_9BACT|nr:hypothetical protein [Roseiconus nitratireducens]KAA5545458.1 hypothetical protein FYK55_07365 [Roseiconus nitratireducens]
MKISRRQFHAAVSSAALVGASRHCHAESVGPLETFVPCRAITRGPGHHWFGYYDKHEFDPTGKLVLTNEVGFEGRSPTADDQITVGLVDTSDGDRWQPVGTSRAWGWQQGCMLQWIGRDGKRILWNDRQDDAFVCRLYDTESKSVRTLPRPIYTVSSDGKFGLSADFRRIDNLRPGYGYDGLADPNVAVRAPEDSGIWRVDLETGRDELILSLADVAAIPWSDGKTHPEAWHYFNHLLVSPDCQRFIVLHRYRPKFDPRSLQFEGGFVTRMLTADVDGRNRYVLDPSGHTSHFIWKDSQEVTMWTKPAGMNNGFYVFTDQTDQVRPVGHDKMPVNGHNTYLAEPYQDWILNDTYPDRQTRRQTVYLYHVPSGRRVDLGHFPSPPEYKGEWRCDTHPRSSMDGHTVAIDSPHDGGRQVYLLDIRDVLNRFG